MIVAQYSPTMQAESAKSQADAALEQAKAALASHQGGSAMRKNAAEADLTRVLTLARNHAAVTGPDAGVWMAAYNQMAELVRKAKLSNLLETRASTRERPARKPRTEDEAAVPVGDRKRRAEEALQEATVEALGSMMGVAVGSLPAAEAPAEASRSSPALLNIMRTAFGSGKQFHEMDQITVSLYGLIWKLAPGDRHAFLSFYHQRMFPEQGTTPVLLASDAGVLAKWVLELFQYTNGVHSTLARVSFHTRYLNPAVLSPHGQRYLLKFIEQLFGAAAQHTGGATDDLVLRMPNKAAIAAVNAAVWDAYKNAPPVAAPVAATDNSDAFDIQEAGQIQQTPASVRKVKIGARAAGLLAATTSYDFEVWIEYDALTVALYRALVLARFKDWLAGAATVPSTVPEASRPDEQRRLDRFHADRIEFASLLQQFKSAVARQRRTGQLLMTEASETALLAELESIETDFVGMYSGRADLLRYLLSQLTGPTPRPDTANHLIVRGEPGTGKTSIADRLRNIMLATGLIEQPTLRAWTQVSASYTGSISEEEHRQLANETIVPGVSAAALRAFTGKATYDALAAARYVQSNTADTVYRPSDFDSTYTGGQTRQFSLAVLRTLGSLMVIDEAYGLANKQYQVVLDLLVQLITDLKLHWGTVLMGYEDRMDALIASGNEGLDRRYAARITLVPYTGLELTAIMIHTALRSTTAVLAPSVVAMEQTLANADWQQEIDVRLDELHAAVAPYAMRPESGAHSPANLFGVSNAGGAGEAFRALSIEARASDSPLCFITGAVADRVMKDRVTRGAPFGRWSSAQPAPV